MKTKNVYYTVSVAVSVDAIVRCERQSVISGHQLDAALISVMYSSQNPPGQLQQHLLSAVCL